MQLQRSTAFAVVQCVQAPDDRGGEPRSQIGEASRPVCAAPRWRSAPWGTMPARPGCIDETTPPPRRRCRRRCPHRRCTEARCRPGRSAYRARPKSRPGADRQPDGRARKRRHSRPPADDSYRSRCRPIDRRRPAPARPADCAARRRLQRSVPAIKLEKPRWRLRVTPRGSWSGRRRAPGTPFTAAADR